MSDQKGDIGSDYNPFEPAWNDTTSTTIEPDGATENLSYIVLVLSLLCALGCLSQYKQNCTTKTAWYLLAPLIAVIGVSLIPMSLLSVRIDDGTTLFCASETGLVERIMSLVGLPAILIISVATLLLLYLIQGRKNSANNSAAEKELIMALAGTSAMYAIFGSISYCFVFYGFWLLVDYTVNDLIFYQAIGLQVNTLGIILRSPILLFMQPMREAFKRGWNATFSK
ncbi:uncharacterized protein LOC134848796 [Symsagittifera roscoffensis]|uniref:uncharacterized protein LOC134848796 n=1 Tax=Symsagittifera roscoffensis TaxID=84072 RepID=UPI00307C2B58